MKKKSEIEYTCLKCGKTKNFNSNEEYLFQFCLECQFKTKHKKIQGQEVMDYSSIKKDFKVMLDDFRDLVRQASYQIRKLEHIEEFVDRAEKLEKKIDKQYHVLIHSLNEEVIQK